MFDLRDFVMRTLRGMAETEPGYKVNQYALGWFDKQVLTADDLAVVDGLTGVVEPAPEETTEPLPEEPVVEPEGGSGTGEIIEEPIEPTPEPPAEEVTEPVVGGESEGETVKPEGENV